MNMNEHLRFPKSWEHHQETLKNRQKIDEIKEKMGQYEALEKLPPPYDTYALLPLLYGDLTIESYIAAVVDAIDHGIVPVIAPMAPVGSGKTKLLELLLADIYRRKGLDLKAKAATIELALRPSGKKSGFHETDDFEAGTQKFQETIEDAINDKTVQLIAAETPANTGHSLQEGTRKIGVDRGVTAYVNLFGKNGTYRNNPYVLFMPINLSIGKSFQKVMEARLKGTPATPPRDEFELKARQTLTATPQDQIPKRSGGSSMGTATSYRDQFLALTEDNAALLDEIDLPKGMGKLYDQYEWRGLMMARQTEWFIRDILKIDSRCTMAIKTIF